MYGDNGYGFDFSWIIWLTIIGGAISFALRIAIQRAIQRALRKRLSQQLPGYNPFTPLNPVDVILRQTFQAYINQYGAMQQDYMRLLAALQGLQAPTFAQPQLVQRQAAVQEAQHRIQTHIENLPPQERSAHQAKLSDVMNGKVRLNNRMEIIEEP